MTQGALADTFKRTPLNAQICRVLMSGEMEKLLLDRKLNKAVFVVSGKVHVTRTFNHKESLIRISRHRDKYNISDVQIGPHCADFVTAGSETTATALSCVTYYLPTTPNKAMKLQEKFQSMFQSYGQITAASTAP